MGFMSIALLIIVGGCGIVLGFFIGRSRGYEEASKDQAGGERVRARYREAAKIFDNLIHVQDLSAPEFPALPSSIQKRVESWLAGHRKDIGITDSTEGK